jgi:hypothetical protein
MMSAAISVCEVLSGKADEVAPVDPAALLNERRPIGPNKVITVAEVATFAGPDEYPDGQDGAAYRVDVDDGVPEPLQFGLNDGVRLMLIPVGGFGRHIGGRDVAAQGSSECVLNRPRRPTRASMRLSSAQAKPGPRASPRPDASPGPRWRFRRPRGRSAGVFETHEDPIRFSGPVDHAAATGRTGAADRAGT